MHHPGADAPINGNGAARRFSSPPRSARLPAVRLLARFSHYQPMYTSKDPDRNMLSNFLNPVRGTRGMAVAPHALASQSALAVLRAGGNAVEAMSAAAATIAVVYPHMNGIGGDGFWLISRPGAEPIGIEACGAAALAATVDDYRARGLTPIPPRGPLAANTVAGTVSGWQLAHRWSTETLGGRLPVKRLLEDAIHYAKNGLPVTRSQAQCVASR